MVISVMVDILKIMSLKSFSKLIFILFIYNPFSIQPLLFLRRQYASCLTILDVSITLELIFQKVLISNSEHNSYCLVFIFLYHINVA